MFALVGLSIYLSVLNLLLSTIYIMFLVYKSINTCNMPGMLHIIYYYCCNLNLNYHCTALEPAQPALA